MNTTVLTREDAEKILFTEARTYYKWQNKPVSNEQLAQVYHLTKMGPTSANCCPLRIYFIQSAEAKERLKPALAEANVEKTMTAPVTAILANDIEFYERLPQLFPHTDARSWFAGNQPLIEETAFRNGTLQAAYFILAARLNGLDCGPMSGFDKDKVDAEFFAGTSIRSNFLCNLGYGDASSLFPRSPRLDFAEACVIL